MASSTVRSEAFGSGSLSLTARPRSLQLDAKRPTSMRSRSIGLQATMKGSHADEWDTASLPHG